MERFLAHLFLLVAGFAVSLGNYWFTFFGFALAGIVLLVVRVDLDKR